MRSQHCHRHRHHLHSHILKPLLLCLCPAPQLAANQQPQPQALRVAWLQQQLQMLWAPTRRPQSQQLQHQADSCLSHLSNKRPLQPLSRESKDTITISTFLALATSSCLDFLVMVFLKTKLCHQD